MKTCRYGCCIDWNGYRAKAKDFRQGGVDISDFDETIKPRKRGRRKGRRTCAKSKTGEACNSLGPVVTERFYLVVTCSRCGRYMNYKWFPTPERTNLMNVMRDGP